MSKELTTSGTNPGLILQAAIEKGVAMDQLERLMGLYERWEANQARKAYFEALTKFQGLVTVIRKKKTAKITPREGGTGYSYKFSDLGTIAETIKKPLQQCSLSYRWEFADVGNEIEVTCLITHKDGHIEKTKMKGPKDTSGGKNLIQQSGSTLTYLQRYSLIGALGLTTADEDNDGANAAPATVSTKARPKVQLTEEEYLLQWKDTVNACKTQLELTSLYLKNRKTVDGDPKIQSIFKERELLVKPNLQTNKVNLP